MTNTEISYTDLTKQEIGLAYMWLGRTFRLTSEQAAAVLRSEIGRAVIVASHQRQTSEVRNMLRYLGIAN